MRKNIFAIIGDDNEAVDYARKVVTEVTKNCVTIDIGEPIRKAVSALLGGADECWCRKQRNKKIEYLELSPAEIGEVIESAVNNACKADLLTFLAFRRIKGLRFENVLLTGIRRPVELDLAKGMRATLVYVARPRPNPSTNDDPLASRVDYYIENTSLAQVKRDTMAILDSVRQ